MDMTKLAYHFRDYKKKAKSTKPSIDNENGKICRQLALTKAGTKPTILIDLIDNINDNFVRVASSTLTYLQTVHRYLTSIKIHSELRET